MRNVCILETLTSVDVQEIVKSGGKGIEIFEGVIYREDFVVNTFRNVIDRKNYFKTKI